tara:strand:+ start:199 stop:438 length:240 start_codon:yes stop_codon:yes gene_type:complete
MTKLIAHLKSIGATGTVNLINGPNGAFISYSINNEKRTMPVGKRSQQGTLESFNVLITEDGTAIATVNHYEEVESLELV